MEDLKEKKRARNESEECELEMNSPEVKRLRENLLDSVDDDSEFWTASQDLDSFMKSFEDEITASPSAPAGDAETVHVGDLTSDSGGSRPDLGYLLEASDDELGLPPPSGLETETRNELARVESDSSELGYEFWEIPGYDSFEFGFVESEATYNAGGNGEYVALDGLFDYSDMGVGLDDVAWRSETLPAQ